MLTRTCIVTLVLFVLWLLLSGHLSPLLLLTGLVSCLFVAYSAHKLALLDTSSYTLRFNLNLPQFLPWFLVAVIKSNLDVSWRILHPKLPISPNISRVPVSKHSDVGKAVYANCITLTPGTYSLDINADTIEVHALTKELANDLQRGEMSKRISALESRAGNRQLK